MAHLAAERPSQTDIMTAVMRGGSITLGNATWPEVRDFLTRGTRTALFAVGSTEQHGPHLPFCTDSLLGDALCAEVAPALGGAIYRADDPL